MFFNTCIFHYIHTSVVIVHLNCWRYPQAHEGSIQLWIRGCQKYSSKKLFGSCGTRSSVCLVTFVTITQYMINVTSGVPSPIQSNTTQYLYWHKRVLSLYPVLRQRQIYYLSSCKSSPRVVLHKDKKDHRTSKQRIKTLPKTIQTSAHTWIFKNNPVSDSNPVLSHYRVIGHICSTDSNWFKLILLFLFPRVFWELKVYEVIYGVSLIKSSASSRNYISWWEDSETGKPSVMYTGGP